MSKTKRINIEKIIHEEIEKLLSEQQPAFQKKKSAELKKDLASFRRETGKAGVTNLERGRIDDFYDKYMNAAQYVNTETGTLKRLLDRVSDILDTIIAKKSKEGKVTKDSPPPMGAKKPSAPAAPSVKAPPPAPRPKV